MADEEHHNNGNETLQKPMTSPEQKYYLRHVHLARSLESLHLGTQITLNGPVYLTGVGRKEIVSIQQKCNCNEKIYSKETSNNQIKEIKRKIDKRWTPRKCFLIGLGFNFLHIIVLIVLHFAYSQPHAIHYVSEYTLNNVNMNLPNFTERQYFGNPYNCSYQCVNLKTKVRFVIPKEILFTPSWYYAEYFYKEFITPKISNAAANFNDVYYNYIIGECGFIFEGRSLTCPFDEPFLSEDHFSLITVGIPYCHPNIYKNIVDCRSKIFKATWKLLEKLRKASILRDDYLLEFPDWCQNTSLLQFLHTKTDRITFHKNNFYNISSEMIHYTNLTVYENYINNYLHEGNVVSVYDNLPQLYYRRPKTFNIKTNCTHQYRKVKSKVRFIITKNDLIASRGNDDLLITGITAINGKTLTFNDYYYNFYFYGPDSLYERRLITCLFSEPFLTEDHSSLIIVGMPYCIPSASNQNGLVYVSKIDEKFKISPFLNGLIKSGVLTDNFTVELPEVCKYNTKLENETFWKAGKVSFHKNDYYNITSELKPEIFRKMLSFEEKTRTITSLNLKKRLIRYETLNYTLPVNAICTHVRHALQSADRIIIRFMFSRTDLEQLNLTQNKSCTENVQTCFDPIMTSYNDENKQLKLDPPNYIVCDGLVLQLAPVNCSFDLKSGRPTFVINIYVIFRNANVYPIENDVIKFSNAMEVIANDIRNCISYTDVNFEFRCDDISFNSLKRQFILLYSILTNNFTYIGINKITGFHEHFKRSWDCP